MAITRPAVAAGAVVAAQLVPALLGIPGVAGALPRLTGPSHRGWIGLTLDDGPHAEGTPAVLDRLSRAGVTATFFVVGEQLLQHPELGRRIVDQGHELAVHGWNHRPPPCRRPGRIGRELADTCELIAAIAGARPRWYRPPYGVATAETLWAAHRLGLRPIWWNRWGRDWKPHATPWDIARTVIGPVDRPRLHGGDVILLHDSDRYGTTGSWRATAAAIPTILRHAASRGLRVGALGDEPPGNRSPVPGTPAHRTGR